MYFRLSFGVYYTRIKQQKMKPFNFLSVAIAVVLMVTAVSCTTMAGTQDDYYNGRSTRAYGDRVYVEDPYRGTVVLERDPRTGRYYEVSPYYNGYYGSRYYGTRAYDPYYGSPYYGRRSGGYSRNNNSPNKNQNNQRPAENDRKTRDEARKKILGN
jgi:hypothetical protein